MSERVMIRGYRWSLGLLVLIGGALALWWSLRPTHEVTFHVDEYTFSLPVHASTVQGALEEIGLSLHPGDVVTPSLTSPLNGTATIWITQARPVYVDMSGRAYTAYAQGHTVRELLRSLGIGVTPGEIIQIEGKSVSPDSTVPAKVRLPVEGLPPWQWPIRPLWLYIRRPIPLYVRDEGNTYVIHTTAPTVGEALREAGVDVYLGDEVYPGLGEPVHAYMKVVIRRSIPIVVEADGRTYQTRTRARQVADALAELGIFTSGLDRVKPGLATPVRPDLRVRITRVSEFVQVEDERIPYETLFVPDDELEIDHRRLVKRGRPGIFRRRYRVELHDGVEVSRILQDAWVAQEPITHVIAYGRRIITRTLNTPDGPVTYWRRIRMLATSYSASTAGVSPTNPWFGYTRLGMKMRKGIVAVDPRVIPLGSRVYVPGYGIGFAGDTGSRILGRRIDLGYDDWNLVLWNQWVDVYVLTPPPPKEKINYLLPNWPRPPR